MKSHPEEHPGFKCTHCDKHFHNSDDLKHHVVSHEGEKPYKCSCDEQFATFEFLRDHMTHNCKQRYKCTKCGKHFHSRGHLRDHMISEESCDKLREKTSECKLCGKKFGFVCVETHLRSHDNVMKYKCVCGKFF